MNDPRYRMDYEEMGLCLILKMDNEGQCSKPSTVNQKDEEKLTHTFEAIGFKVRKEEEEKTFDDIRDILESVAVEDHTKRSCFVCVILCHGDENKYFEFKDLLKYFKGDECKTLAGKPKLFFIQACTKDRESVEPCSGEENIRKTMKIPSEADILCYYSTPQDTRSCIKPDGGSWFIQTLCEMLENWKEYELMKILTCVNRKVALQCDSCTREMPCIVSRLTKLLYLK